MINLIKTALARWRSSDNAVTLPPALLKNLYPLLLLAIGLTAMVLMYLWSDQSTYKPVFGAREKVSAPDMMAVLDSDHIPYRVHPDSGQVLVPQSMLGKVRMLLAAKGVTAQLPAGLELMDKNDPLGVSQFVQDVRFRRGLEGELAQSIMTLDAIAHARVHLSIAKSTSFVSSDGEKSSASVVVQTKPGQTLSSEAIAAVVNMVAGSVASLTPQRVSLVDQNGNLLSARVDLSDGFDAAATSNEGSKRYQDEVKANIKSLLGPVIGDDNYRVSVTATVDNDKVEETVEKYGADPKVTSEAMREEQDRNRMVMGVPGTLSNRPPAANPNPAEAAKQGGDVGNPGTLPDGTARKNATSRQYAYDRSIVQTRHARGRLQKLGVAVVLAQAAAPTPKTGWSAAEIANIDKILRNGLAMDNQRGDQLVVSAMNFPTRQPITPWWQERDTVVDISGYVMYGVALLLGYMLILRPLMRLLTVRLTPSPAAQARIAAERRVAEQAAQAAATVAAKEAASGISHAPGAPALAGHAAGSAAGLGGIAALGAGAPAPGGMPVVPLLENYDLPPAGSAVDVMVEHLKVLAGKEPERVAEVVKQWMQKNGRTQQS